MKKLSIILLALFFANVCAYAQQTGESTENKTIIKGLNKKSYNIDNGKLGQTFQKYIDAQNYYALYGAHEIYYDDLIKYVKNYVNQFSYKAQHDQLGGFIPAGDITGIPEPSQIDLKSGLLYFLCYDKGVLPDTTDDRIYIAYLDKVDNFNMTSDYIDRIPGAKPCKIAYNAFQYNDMNPADSARIATFLSGPFSPNGDPPETKEMSKVRIDMQEFHDRFVNRCFNLAAGRRVITCNKNAFGFFEKSEILTLTNQTADIRGVRFFLGINEYKSENQIRVAVVSATAVGNLLKIGDNFAKFIERSYP